MISSAREPAVLAAEVKTMDRLPEMFYVWAERAVDLRLELGERAFRALIDEANLGPSRGEN